MAEHPTASQQTEAEAVRQELARMAATMEVQHQILRATGLILAGVVLALVTPAIWGMQYRGPGTDLWYPFLLLLAPLCLAATAVRVARFKLLAIALWAAHTAFGASEGVFSTGSRGFTYAGAMIIMVTGLALIPVQSTED
ncbi:MAG: hypothetical protein ACRDT4_17710 [Micromonosporaceae bacterium]